MRYHNKTTGYTILELSIVITIIALILAGAFKTLIGSVTASQTNSTVATMQAIDTAIQNYVTINGRLPCPGDLKISSTPGSGSGATSNQYYGQEAANHGSCTGGSPAATFFNNTTPASATVAEGAVPTATLGLPNSYMYDGWGNHIRYAVYIKLTSDSSSTPPINKPVFSPVGGLCSPIAALSAITVEDASDNPRTTSATNTVTGPAVYALLSHGANGYGAYTNNGTAMTAPVSTDELTNYHSANGFTATFVQKTPACDSAHQSGSAADSQYCFDDIVSYKMAWQLATPNSPPVACLFAVDPGNSRVQAFDKNGNYIYSFGGYTFGFGGLELPYALAIDPNGYLWVSESTNNRIEKLNINTGAPLSTSGASQVSAPPYNGGNCTNTNPYPTAPTSPPQAACTASYTSGNFYTPTGIALDSTPNVYVVDQASGSNSRVQKLTSITSTADTASTIASTLPTTAAGIAVNGSNIYVADGTSAIQKSTGGAFNSSFATTADSISITSPQGVAVDSSGNVWVADSGKHRVLEYSSGGVLQTIGPNTATCTSGATCNKAIGTGYQKDAAGTKGTAGNAQGQFNTPTSVAVDAAGNIWVADQYNNRLQEFDSNGNFLRVVGGTGIGTNGSGSGIAQFYSYNGTTAYPLTITYSSR